MSYAFDYDFGKLPREFFREIAKIVGKRKLHKKFGGISKILVRKFNVDKLLGIQAEDALSIVEDLTDVYINNMLHAAEFRKAKVKVLFIPHCCRKYMDSKCKAKFNPELSYFSCVHCSPDCPANKATKLGESRGYKVFILPGGSCIKKIMKKVNCDAILGIACPEELKLGIKYVESKNKIVLGIPLTKNGCCDTDFNIESLEEALV